MEIFRVNIKEILRNQGLTQADLAERIGISSAALSGHISGNPSLKILQKIADALRVPPWVLLWDRSPLPHSDKWVLSMSDTLARVKEGDRDMIARLLHSVAPDLPAPRTSSEE